MTPGIIHRQRALDWARGLAVVSMVIAHTCPVGGIFNATEYLTAPLFALLLGTSLTYAWNNTTDGLGRFWAAETARGLILVLGGLGLQSLYPPIWDVLVSLGLLVMILPPLLALPHRPATLGTLVVALLALAGPLAALGQSARLDPTASWAWREVAFWTIGHPTYPLHLMLAASLLGVLLALPLAGHRWPPTRLAVIGAGCGLVAVAALAAGRLLLGGGAPYDGSYPTAVVSLALAAGALVLSFALAEVAPARLAAALFPLEATGRLALSCYVLQIVWLVLVTSLLTGGTDDSWAVLGSLLVSLVGFATAWVRLRGPLGPAEWLVRLPHALSRASRSVP